MTIGESRYGAGDFLADGWDTDITKPLSLIRSLKKLAQKPVEAGCAKLRSWATCMIMENAPAQTLCSYHVQKLMRHLQTWFISHPSLARAEGSEKSNRHSANLRALRPWQQAG